MAKVPSKGTRVHLGGFRFSSFLSSAESNIVVETPDVTAFGDAGPRVVVGNYNHNHNFQGFLDADSTYGGLMEYDEPLFDQLGAGTRRVLTTMYNGQNLGTLAGYSNWVRIGEQPRIAKVGQAVLCNFSAVGDGTLARVYYLYYLNGALGASPLYSTGYNLGATTIEPHVVAAHLFSGTYTSISVIAQESNDDGSGDPYTDVGNGITLYSAGASMSTPSLATTKAWKRLKILHVGGTAAFIFGFWGIAIPE